MITKIEIREFTDTIINYNINLCSTIYEIAEVLYIFHDHPDPTKTRLINMDIKLVDLTTTSSNPSDLTTTSSNPSDLTTTSSNVLQYHCMIVDIINNTILSFISLDSITNIWVKIKNLIGFTVIDFNITKILDKLYIENTYGGFVYKTTCMIQNKLVIYNQEYEQVHNNKRSIDVMQNNGKRHKK